ncbi:MAG TPA: SDR family oxidoreductase, partial [Candidatus Sulfotelmatobacter sp.]|nr:SDR family oxidoreductase [Candidatus Sulfotelmatobacter sp.]
RELGPSGVTVNAISPGPIQTAPATDVEVQKRLSGIPIGRLGTPQDIAALCGHLASEAGGFISGQMIAVNGGGTT